MNVYEQLKEREMFNNAEIAHWQRRLSDEAMFRIEELLDANRRLQELMKAYEEGNEDETWRNLPSMGN